MNDTISRQAALDVIRAMQTYKLHEGDDMLLVDKAEAQTELMTLPSVQPELIRCKDCKHRPIATRADEGVLWGFSVEFPDERCPLQCEDGWYNHYPKDVFYCANAERTERCV